MKVASKYNNSDPQRAMVVAVLDSAKIEAEKLGESRRKLHKKRQRWSKYSKRWGAFHRLLWFLWSDRFAKLVDLLDQDLEVFRAYYLKQLAAPVVEVASEREEKRCPRCKKTKVVSVGFGYRRVGSKTRAQSWCKDCR